MINTLGVIWTAVILFIHFKKLSYSENHYWNSNISTDKVLFCQKGQNGISTTMEDAMIHLIWHPVSIIKFNNADKNLNTILTEPPLSLTFPVRLLCRLKCNYYGLDRRWLMLTKQASKQAWRGESFQREWIFFYQLNPSACLTHFPIYLGIWHWTGSGHLLDSLCHANITWSKNIPPSKKAMP